MMLQSDMIHELRLHIPSLSYAHKINIFEFMNSVWSCFLSPGYSNAEYIVEM